MATYTDVQIARMTAEAPLNAAKAADLASEFGGTFTARSVISKAISLEIPYEKKPKAAKKGRGVTKAELVAQITDRTGVEFKSLQNAATEDLQALLALV